MIPRTDQTEQPRFIHDLRIVERQINTILSRRPENLDLFYAMKANPHPAILELMRQKGVGIETTSRGEIALARSAGIEGERLLLTGPGKSFRTMSYAIENDIGTIIVESEREAERVNSLAAKKRQSVLVRISPQHTIAGAHLEDGFALFGGRPVKYGIDEELCVEALERIATLPNLEITGIHVFAASGVKDYRLLINHVNQIFATVQGLPQAVGTIDFGGGIGYDHIAGDCFDIDAYFSGLKDSIETFRFHEKRLILELGTYLVAPATTYVAPILDVKESRGERFLIVDGGIHHLARPSLVTNHRTTVYDREGKPTDNEGEADVNIVGNLCHPLDTLATGLTIPFSAQSLDHLVGGTVHIHNCGAYGQNLAFKGFSLNDKAQTYIIERDGRLRCD